MSPPIFAIRPEPGFSATIAAGRALGLDILGEPLFAIEPRPWEAPRPDSFDALLLGSANALRHGGAALERYLEKPLYAVGAMTAEAARAAGFPVAAAGRGSLQELLDEIADAKLRLLRLSGAEHVQVQAPAGITIETRIVYESRPLPIPDAFAERLRHGGVVLLHSAAAARHFGQECERHGIARSSLAMATLGPRISAAAGLGWQVVRSASEPSEAALLVLARDMCQ